MGIAKIQQVFLEASIAAILFSLVAFNEPMADYVMEMLVADDADRAGELIERRQAEIDRVARAPVSKDVSALECFMCGETIPEARRVVLPGVKVCVECSDRVATKAALRL